MATVLLSPFISPKQYPAWIVKPLARTLLLLPDQYWWWDEKMQEMMPGPRDAYPRYPSHAIAEIMRLSLAVRQQAARQYPAPRGSGWR